MYEQKKETVDLLHYRNHVIRLLVNYRLPVYKTAIVNGQMDIWYVGNSNELVLNDCYLATMEEFSKFTKEFLASQLNSVVFFMIVK